jgi:hypothetical protein
LTHTGKKLKESKKVNTDLEILLTENKRYIEELHVIIKDKDYEIEELQDKKPDVSRKYDSIESASLASFDRSINKHFGNQKDQDWQEFYSENNQD